MVDQNLLLVAYAVPMVFGLVLMTKSGDGLANGLSQRNPLLAHARRPLTREPPSSSSSSCFISLPYLATRLPRCCSFFGESVSGM